MSVHNYKTEILHSRAQEDSQKLDASNRAAWAELLARFPLADNTANYNLFVEYCNPLTIAGGEHLIRMKPQGFDFALTTREALIEELVKLRRAGASKKTLSDYDLQSWKVRISVWSLRQLRDYKTKLTFLKEHQTAESAKEFLAGVRKTEPNPFPGWPRLPERMVLPYGPIVYTDINAEYLQNLVRSDFYAFKRLCTLYGSTQVDARMKGIA
jgi:hypothetical protein